MHQFALITDSAVDQTSAYFVQNDIAYAPLSFTIDGQTIAEDCGQALGFHEFYERLRQGKQPITTQVNPDGFMPLFRAALERGQDVLYVGFSSGLSGTFQSGCIARDMLASEFPERKIFCVDSLSATGGEALLLDKAREMRDSGCSAEVTAAAIEQMKLRIVHLVAVDDLDHLHRGGRISKTSAIVGGLLGVKPLIWIDNQGKLQVNGKVRGRKKVIDYLFERTMREITDRKQVVRIGHGDCPDDANALAARFAQEGIASEVYYVGTVIGSHTGPGVLTSIFFGTERKA